MSGAHLTGLTEDWWKGYSEGLHARFPSIRHLCYEERLRKRLPSLYYRRKRGDTIYVYQLFNGGVDIIPNKFFTRVSDGPT